MNNINLRSPLAVLLLAAFGACENPVSHEDHAEPEGIVIRAGTTELVRVEGTGAGGVVTGAVSVSVGAQSPELTVSFIDHDGDDLPLEPGEYWLSGQSTPTDSATATWQGTEAGSFTGRVSGHSTGAITLSFQLHHGVVDGGHPEEDGGGPYEVPVTVTATQQ
jgi:hypothetical protein